MSRTVTLGAAARSEIAAAFIDRIYQTEIDELNTLAYTNAKQFANNWLSAKDRELMDAHPEIKLYTQKSHNNHKFRVVRPETHPDCYNMHTGHSRRPVADRQLGDLSIPSIRIDKRYYRRTRDIVISLQFSDYFETSGELISARRGGHLVRHDDNYLLAYIHQSDQSHLSMMDITQDMKRLVKYLSATCKTVNHVLSSFPNAYKVLPHDKQNEFDPMDLAKVRGFQVPDWCAPLDRRIAVSLGMEALAKSTA